MHNAADSDLRSVIRSEVAHITPFDDLEADHRDTTLAWIDSGAPLCRTRPPDVPPMHLVSYFVVIDPDHDNLLLGDHIKAQLWLPSGGHVEPGEHPRDTVVREAGEELGLAAVFLRDCQRPFFITINQTGGLTPGHSDVSLWYLLRGDKHRPLRFDRREFNDMEWFGFDEILQSHPAIFDRNMHRFTRKLLEPPVGETVLEMYA